MIVLNENYYIEPRPYNIVLVFHEMREREEKDGTKKQYESTDETFHGSIVDALKAFLRKSLIGSKSVEECLQKIKEAEEKIDAFFVSSKINEIIKT